MDTAESAGSKEAVKDEKTAESAGSNEAVKDEKTAESADSKEVTKEEKIVEVTKEEKMDTTSADEVKEKKVDPDYQMLANPARVLPQQV